MTAASGAYQSYDINARNAEEKMGIGMTISWKGFTPGTTLERAVAQYLVALTPYAYALQECEVIVEALPDGGGAIYEACVHLRLCDAHGEAGPVHCTADDADAALREAFGTAKAQLDLLMRRAAPDGMVECP